MVQWLTFFVPSAECLAFIPDQGTRSHMLQLKMSHTAMTIKDRVYHN